jgi:hypothetical protein
LNSPPWGMMGEATCGLIIMEPLGPPGSGTKKTGVCTALALELILEPVLTIILVAVFDIVLELRSNLMKPVLDVSGLAELVLISGNVTV